MITKMKIPAPGVRYGLLGFACQNLVFVHLDDEPDMTAIYCQGLAPGNKVYADERSIVSIGGQQFMTCVIAPHPKLGGRLEVTWLTPTGPASWAAIVNNQKVLQIIKHVIANN